MRGGSRLIAVTGALTYAATGVVWGSRHEGWFGLARDASGLQLWLGVGAALLLAGFATAGWGARLRRAGTLGSVALCTLVAGAALNVVGAVVDFAILGTLGLGLGLVLLAVVVFRERSMPRSERWLVAASAVLSLTWNTETATAWFLVANGALWVVLSVRLLAVRTGPDEATPDVLAAAKGHGCTTSGSQSGS